MNFFAQNQVPAPVVLAKGAAGHNMKRLPVDFIPGKYDVICGRGSRVWAHPGNQHFRRLVAMRLQEYAKTSTKLEKSYILYAVVAQIRLNSPHGGFVRKCSEERRWYEVGDFLAREKTSQAFRDALHDQYKSSNEAKKKRRKNGGSGSSSKSAPICGSVISDNDDSERNPSIYSSNDVSETSIANDHRQVSACSVMDISPYVDECFEPIDMVSLQSNSLSHNFIWNESVATEQQVESEIFSAQQEFELYEAMLMDYFVVDKGQATLPLPTQSKSMDLFVTAAPTELPANCVTCDEHTLYGLINELADQVVIEGDPFEPSRLSEKLV